jgi:hypothetical protein
MVVSISVSEPGSALDPHSMAAWIRIRIPNAEPDPEKVNTWVMLRSSLLHQEDQEELK